MEDHKELMDAFPATGKQQWMDQVVKDLKGAAFETLEQTTPDGITIAPFYTREDIAEARPVFTHTDWEIQETIEVANEEAANKQALACLQQGVTRLRFILLYEADFARLLKDIQIRYISLAFDLFDHHWFHARFEAYLQANDLAWSDLDLTLSYDPISHLTNTGKWIDGGPVDLRDFTLFSRQNSHRQQVCIDGTIYHEAGASPAYELACILAHANEYLNVMEDKAGLTVQVDIAVDADYFTGIARLRAARRVFALLLDTYGADGSIYLHAASALRNLTIYDQHNNLLRTTTGAMAAVAGGCNSLEVAPFDETYKAPDAFSRRMARNIQLILKGESYFDKVSDVAAGAYYIETLTEALAQKAWTYFQAIEQQGGLIECLKQGIIQQQTADFAAADQALFDAGKKILVGINKYPLPTQRMAEQITARPDRPAGAAAADITPLQPVRLAAAAEAARLANEKEGATA